MIQDDRGSTKKAWKAFQANYDDVFALSDRLCSYCLSDQMVQALLTMTEYLKWSTRWVSAAGTIDDEQIQLFASQLEYRLMNGCCDDQLPIQWRYSPAGTLQQSMNGGGTWTDAPNYDPRVYSPTFPAVAGDDGDDKKCIASTGAAALIKEQVGDQLTDDMGRYTLNQLITDWVKTMIQSSNPFEALVTVVTNQIFALVLATLIPALTDEVYEQLQCIFYCNMADDASFNTSQWQTVQSDITSKITGIAGLFLEHLVYLIGEKGLTNLARAGAASTGDCSGCTDCPACDGFNFLVSDGGWDAQPTDWGNAGGEWISGAGWSQTFFDHFPAANVCNIKSPITPCPPGEYDITLHIHVTAVYGSPVYGINLQVKNNAGDHNEDGLSDLAPGDYVWHFGTIPLAEDDNILFNTSSIACDYQLTAVEIDPHV